MAAGGSQVPATGNIGQWNAVVGEVRRCLIPETPVYGYGMQACTALSSHFLFLAKRDYVTFG